MAALPRLKGTGVGWICTIHFTLLIANKSPTPKVRQYRPGCLSVVNHSLGRRGRVLRIQPVSRMHAIYVYVYILTCIHIYTYIITDAATGIGTKLQHPKPCKGHKKKPQKQKLGHSSSSLLGQMYLSWRWP